MKLPLLQELVVAPYTTTIMTDHSIKKVFYNVKRKKKGKVPPGMLKKIEEGKLQVDSKGFVLNDGERIIANKRTFGKERYMTIAGNQFTTGFSNYGHRNAVVTNVKAYLRPYIEQQLAPFQLFPLYITCHLYLYMGNQTSFDLSNLWFWSKYMEDILFECDQNGNSLIPDDEWLYITRSGGCPTLVPIDNPDESKLVWTFYHDIRPCVMNNPIWAAWHSP